MRSDRAARFSDARVATAALAMLTLAILTAACGQPSVSASPSAPPSAAPSTPARSPEPSSSSGLEPSACPTVASSGPLRANRLVRMRVDARAGLVEFGFAGPLGPVQASGRLEGASPPFSHAASGLPLEVAGERVVRVRFDGQEIYDEAGNAYYAGPPSVSYPAGPVIRAVVLEDNFEGVISWLVGFDGPGCAEISSSHDGTVVLLTIGGG